MAQKSHMATHHNFCNNGSVIVYSHVTEFPSFITLCIFNLPYWDILMPLSEADTRAKLIDPALHTRG